MGMLSEQWTPAVALNLADADPEKLKTVIRQFNRWVATQPDALKEPLPITTGWQLFTPQLCQDLLRRNLHNREITFDAVYGYALSMVNKQWIKTGETISFST